MEVLNQINHVFYSDPDLFIGEYKSLLPDIASNYSPEWIVFAHNDTQENNFLSTGDNTKIIDFEYSQLNYRGLDLVSYIIESTIDYSVKEQPFFNIDENLFPNFDENSFVDKMIQMYLFLFYNKYID